MEQESDNKLILNEGGPMGQATSIQEMSLNKIKTGKNSRLSVSKEELDGLMQSIKEVGLLQPIGVTKTDGGGYEICYGNRRFMACSKLGMAKIPVIIHDKKKESDIDLKNLTENIQRRNIGLSEAGRYMELLRKGGLTVGEMAVRLGVSRNYVEACVRAYNEVPDKFKNDLELSIGKKTGHGNKAKAIGKISVSSANRIINAAKSYRLSQPQKEKMFEMAKSDDRFLPENSRKYALAIKNGAKDPIAAVKPMQHVSVQFWITKDDYEELRRKYVDGGPFNNMSGLFKSVLAGKKSVKIPIVDLAK